MTLYVAPEGGGKVSDVLEASLKAYFEDKRMLSQIVEIQDVDYVPIFVTAEIGVQSFYVRSDVQAGVQAGGAGAARVRQCRFRSDHLPEQVLSRRSKPCRVCCS